MMKPNLGLIITGQLRTFFTEEVFNSFYNYVSVLKGVYNLYVVCVISEDAIDYGKFAFLKELCADYKIVKFDKGIVKFPPKSFYDTVIREEICSEDYELHVTSFLYQKKQLDLGVRTMREFENIDIYIKTRFDMFYGEHLIPYSNPNPLFPHSKTSENNHTYFLHKNGFPSVEHYQAYQLRQGRMTSQRIPEHLYPVNFGGAYYYNKDIFDTNPKMWLSNDYIFIGARNIFEQYTASDIFLDPLAFLAIAKDKNINIPFSEESLMFIHLYYAGITPMCTLNQYTLYVVR